MTAVRADAPALDIGSRPDDRWPTKSSDQLVRQRHPQDQLRRIDAKDARVRLSALFGQDAWESGQLQGRRNS
jgi:hypothetical protein